MAKMDEKAQLLGPAMATDVEIVGNDEVPYQESGPSVALTSQQLAARDRPKRESLASNIGDKPPLKKPKIEPRSCATECNRATSGAACEDSDSSAKPGKAKVGAESDQAPMDTVIRDRGWRRRSTRTGWRRS